MLKMAAFAPMPRARVATTVTANPGDLRNCRNAKPASRHKFSRRMALSASATLFRITAGLPNFSRASRLASAAAIPAAILSATRISRCDLTSASISRCIREREKRLRTRRISDKGFASHLDNLARDYKEMIRNVKDPSALLVDKEQQRSPTHNHFAGGLFRSKWVFDVLRAHQLTPLPGGVARWEGELHSFLRRVDDQQETVVDDRLTFLVGDLQRFAVQEDANGTIPVRAPGFIGNLLSIRVKPGNIHLHDIPALLADRAGLKEFAAMKIRVRRTNVNETGSEFQKPFPRLVQVPVVPRQLIVLAIGVVISSLRTSDFIASRKHRHTLRQHQSRQKITHLAFAERVDGLIAGRPFGAHIPGIVVV